MQFYVWVFVNVFFNWYDNHLIRSYWTYTGMKAYSTDREDKKLVSVCMCVCVCDTTRLGNYVS